MWIAHTGSPSTFSWCPQHLQGGLFLRHCLNEIGVLAKQPSVSSRYGSTASPRGPDPHHPTDSCPKRLRKGKCDGRALDMLNGSQLKIHTPKKSSRLFVGFMSAGHPDDSHCTLVR